MFRTVLKLLAALTVLSLASSASAQQSAVTIPPQPAQAASQPAQVTSEPAAPASVPAVASAPDNVQALKPSAAVPHDLSPWSMFLSADIVVKAVMIGLAFASIITWTIFIGKSIELSTARRKLRLALKQSADARSLAEAQFALASKDTVLSMLLAAALREARMSAGISSDSGIKERAASSFAEIARAEARRIRLGMGLLATIGATAPFVGLFGTVWGIMNSFIGISRAQTTNLAVVAPGIAEALLATAIGLVAAIPAVIMYNHFARATKGYVDLVGRGSGAIARLLSRDLGRARGRGRLATHAAE